MGNRVHKEEFAEEELLFDNNGNNFHHIVTSVRSSKLRRYFILSDAYEEFVPCGAFSHEIQRKIGISKKRRETSIIDREDFHSAASRSVQLPSSSEKEIHT